MSQIKIYLYQRKGKIHPRIHLQKHHLLCESRPTDLHDDSISTNSIPDSILSLELDNISLDYSRNKEDLKCIKNQT